MCKETQHLRLPARHDDRLIESEMGTSVTVSMQRREELLALLYRHKETILDLLKRLETLHHMVYEEKQVKVSLLISLCIPIMDLGLSQHVMANKLENEVLNILTAQICNE